MSWLRRNTRPLAALAAAILGSGGLLYLVTWPEVVNHEHSNPRTVAAGEYGRLGEIELRLDDVWARSTLPNGDRPPLGTTVLVLEVAVRQLGGSTDYCHPMLAIDGDRWDDASEVLGPTALDTWLFLEGQGCSIDQIERRNTDGSSPASWVFVVPEDVAANARTATLDVMRDWEFPDYLRFPLDPSELH